MGDVRRPAARAVTALALLTACVACGPRYTRRPVEAPPGLTIFLRGQTQHGEILDQGLDQPVSISGVRLTHILAQIDVRDDDGRRPLIPTEVLYPMGDAVSRALARAGPGEEVVVQLVRRDRTLIFTHEYLTTLILYVKDDDLVVHVRHFDSELERDARQDKIPEPWAHKTVTDSFRIVPGDGMTSVGSQEVSAYWRDPIFRKPRRIVVTGTGEVKRRTVLMESPPEDEGGTEPAPEATGELSPDALRALADLEEERRAGRITEGDYQARRRSILAQEAGAP
jgi:hypothetical protein